jgi:hypothetical protein
MATGIQRAGMEVSYRRCLRLRATSVLVVVVITFGRRFLTMMVVMLVLVTVVTVVVFMLGLMPIILVVMRVLALMIISVMMVIMFIVMAVIAVVMVMLTVLAFIAGWRFFAMHVQCVRRTPRERGEQGKGQQAPGGAVFFLFDH